MKFTLLTFTWLLYFQIKILKITFELIFKKFNGLFLPETLINIRINDI